METLKIYCDANVFIDYFDDEKKSFRPLKQFAFEFFSKGWNCKFNLVISDFLLYELRKHLKESQINEILNEYKSKNKLEHVNEDKKDRAEAMKISEHWQDPLHAILANRAKADYLITRDRDGYEKCLHLVKVKWPESI